MKQIGRTIAMISIPLAVTLMLLGGWGQYIVILMTLVLFIYSALLLHELGHLIAGLLLGYSFRFLVIGPVNISKKNGQFTVTLNSSPHWGQCAMQVKFVDYETDRTRLMWYLAGGSLANLVALVIGCALYFVTDHLIWLLLMLFHFAFGVVALLPLKAENGAYSDGLGISLLRRKGRSARLFYMLFELSYIYTFAADIKELERLLQDKVDLVEQKLLSEVWVGTDHERYELDLVMNLLYCLVGWQTINGRFAHTVQLLRPWVEQHQLSGALKEELLLAYSFAKLATGDDLELVPDKATVRHPVMLRILNQKIEALRHCQKGNTEKAIAILQYIRDSILCKQPYLLGSKADIAVLDKYIQVVRNHAPGI